MSNKHRILALDPSSTKTGYAVMDNPDSYIEAGCLVPKNGDPKEGRVWAMVTDALDLSIEFKPDIVVIEDTTGKVAGRFKKKDGTKTVIQGQSVYGFALGAIWHAFRICSIRNPILIKENEWTASVPKADRIKKIKLIYPQYDPDQDIGGDAADALGLGRYFLLRERSQSCRMETEVPRTH